MIVTYIKVSDKSKTKFKFEIGGKAAQDYIALGLSDDNQMGDDSVMACIKNPKTSLVNVSMYWNSASWSTPLSDAHYGLSEMSGSLEDDFYTCTFHRDAVLNI